jgi:hypothetical protein
VNSWEGLASSLGTAAGMVTASITQTTSSPALSAVMVTVAGSASFDQPRTGSRSEAVFTTTARY